MSGRVYVDGLDLYGRWGLYVADVGVWNDLVAMPPLKDVDSTDWHEEDGIEADLAEPVLDTRNISLTFAFKGDVHKQYFSFIEFLTDGAYHEFDCRYIGRKYKLRMVSHTNFDYATQLGKIKVKFADDFPLDGYEYQAPMTSIAQVEDYLFDNVPFTAYGVRVLQGSLEEVMKPANVKENLLRNIETVAGAIYDAESVTYESKDVKLSCLMRAESLTELWQNFDALLYDLIRPDEHLLYVSELQQEFPFYYKKCSVSEFFPEGRPWLKFTITLTFTNDFRITDDVVLATEDRQIVITENGVDAIDLATE